MQIKYKTYKKHSKNKTIKTIYKKLQKKKKTTKTSVCHTNLPILREKTEYFIITLTVTAYIESQKLKILCCVVYCSSNHVPGLNNIYVWYKRTYIYLPYII